MLLEPARARRIRQHESVGIVVRVGEDEVRRRKPGHAGYLGGVTPQDERNESRRHAMPNESNLRPDWPWGGAGEGGLRGALDQEQSADDAVTDLESLLDD